MMATDNTEVTIAESKIYVRTGEALAACTCEPIKNIEILANATPYFSIQHLCAFIREYIYFRFYTVIFQTFCALDKKNPKAKPIVLESYCGKMKAFIYDKESIELFDFNENDFDERLEKYQELAKTVGYDHEKLYNLALAQIFELANIKFNDDISPKNHVNFKTNYFMPNMIKFVEVVNKILSESATLTNNHPQSQKETPKSNNMQASEKNSKSKFIHTFMAIIICLFLFVPYEMTYNAKGTHATKFYGYSFIFSPPQNQGAWFPSIDWTRLGIEIFIASAVVKIYYDKKFNH